MHSAILGLMLLAATASVAEPLRHEVAAGVARAVDAQVVQVLPDMLGHYRHLHANPELSLHEAGTAAYVAAFLAERGFEVDAGVGGHGVVGQLSNGDGPVLLIRGDMDALPVTEATGLPFASRVRTLDDDGVEVGTMHACGHDMHVTNLLGTAAILARLREHWRGTLVILAQPAEELGLGALHMLDDGLFEKIPRPDHGLALHVDGDLPTGTIGYVSGWGAANVDSVDIVVHGRGGHGARPHQTVDPIAIAAQMVSAFQTIVSRRIDPSQPAVVTVGSIHGGSKGNVIPDEVRMALTVRSYSDEVRVQLLDSIAQIARGTCEAHGCTKPPEVRVKDPYTPALYNDPGLTRHAVAVFGAMLGEDAVRPIVPTMTGEDFGRYTRAGGFPTLLYRLGSVNPERWQRAQRAGAPPLPSLHSSRYAPDAEATLEVGLRSMVRVALSLLAPGP